MPLDINDEAILVKRCKNNDPVAQKMLYGRYAEGMMLVCLRYISSREDAKEALMDSFLKFFQRINTFTYHGEGSVKAWLKKITVNQCLAFLRKRRMVTEALDVYSEDVAGGEDILAGLAAKDIMTLVQSLPDGYRTVFNLYAFEGMSHKEIGGLLDISEQTSKSQLHRARAMLKEKSEQANKVNYETR